METYKSFKKNYDKKYNAYLKAYGNYKTYCYDTLFELLSKLEDKTMYLYHNNVRLFSFTILVNGVLTDIDTVKIRIDPDNSADIVLYDKDGRWWSFTMLETFECGYIIEIAYDYLASKRNVKSKLK
jgi:hypothetical protein